MAAKRKIHTTNPTEIIEINKADVTIRLDDNSSQNIHCRIIDLPNFQSLGLDKDAMITVWANCGDNSIPISCGTVGECEPPKGAIPLKDIDGKSHITFRIIVWDKDSKKILASNERLNVTKDGQVGILHVVPRNIGEELWKLNLAENEPPELFVNEKIPNIKELLKNDPKVRGSVLPEVVRQILVHLNFSDAYDTSDSEAWQNVWRRWLTERGETDPVPVDTDPEIDYYTILNWADDIIQRFAKEHSCAESVILEGEKEYE